MDTKRTSDIYLSAAFSALGARLEAVDKTDPKHMVFEFSPKSLFTTGTLKDMVKQDLDAIENDWVNKCLMVNAVDFAEAIKRLKSVVHTK